MARHYTNNVFFRQMPNAMLARYFQGRELFGDLDFSAMKEGKPDALFDAWLTLTEAQRNTMDAEFRGIFDMSCEKGFRAIIDEAESQMDEKDFTVWVRKFSAFSGHYERAMATFLDHKNFWKVATLFYHADTLSYWRKRNNLPHKKAAGDNASINELAKQICTYFYSTDGRGNHCVVEHYRRGELDYYFAYPEDYSQKSIEWVDGEFAPRPHNPAFEVIFVYSKNEGSLDVNFRGSYKAIEPLQSRFAKAILKLDELPPDPKDARVYNLAPLLKKDFNFVPAVGSGIERVVVKKLRLSSRVKKGDRITLEADTSENPNAVYALLKQIGKTLPMDQYIITQVELVATVVDADKPAKLVKFHITYPNSCSLKYDELDLKLRNMLEASGIEPKALAKKVKAVET